MLHIHNYIYVLFICEKLLSMEFNDKAKLLKLEYEHEQLVEAHKDTRERLQRLERRVLKLEDAQSVSGGSGASAGFRVGTGSFSSPSSKRGRDDDHVIDLRKDAKSNDDDDAVDPRPSFRILDTKDWHPAAIAQDIAQYRYFQTPRDMYFTKPPVQP